MSERAAIFDLDGTLVDNIPFHVKAWEVWCARLGLRVDLGRFYTEFNGKKNDEIIPAVLDRPVAAEELTQLAELKEATYRELYAPHITPMPGFRAFLEKLKSLGVPCAIATAAPLANRNLVLSGLKLGDAFEVLVGAEEVKRGKPAPDFFLLAARKLNIAPQDCCVFEDAENGIAAARQAGMRSIGVTTTATAEALRKQGAGLTIAHYEEVPSELTDWLKPH